MIFQLRLSFIADHTDDIWRGENKFDNSVKDFFRDLRIILGYFRIFFVWEFSSK